MDQVITEIAEEPNYSKLNKQLNNSFIKYKTNYSKFKQLVAVGGYPQNIIFLDAKKDTIKCNLNDINDSIESYTKNMQQLI